MNEYPKLIKEKPKKIFSKHNKRGVMVRWDNSDSSKDDSKKEQASITFMTGIEDP